jgi:transposase InsO family protein
LGRKVLAEVASLVTPETILRWHRQLIAKKYNGARTRRPGRPRTRQDIAALVVRMATENPKWGYTRIKGALRLLGHDIGRSTIPRILEDSGIEPAPERGQRTSWKTFIAAHCEVITAADFFNVEVLTVSGLVRYWVLLVIDVSTRRVHIAGITSQPHAAWMQQMARNLLDAVDGFLLGKRYIILDRDPLYTKAFRAFLENSGVKVVRLPPKSPDLNPHAERFVLSIKAECLERVVLLGEWHLRRAIKAYMEHYHRERPHQGTGNRLIDGRTLAANDDGQVQCRERLGGLLRYYHREAA